MVFPARDALLKCSENIVPAWSAAETIQLVLFFYSLFADQEA